MLACKGYGKLSKDMQKVHSDALGSVFEIQMRVSKPVNVRRMESSQRRCENLMQTLVSVLEGNEGHDGQDGMSHLCWHAAFKNAMQAMRAI